MNCFGQFNRIFISLEINSCTSADGKPPSYDSLNIFGNLLLRVVDGLTS